MNKPLLWLAIFCLGVLVGIGEENPIMNLITIMAFIGAIFPNSDDLEDVPEEEERREPKARLVRNPYYNRYKP
nr:MAG TPA: hypothetical protein [Caudoviricetes sp.]